VKELFDAISQVGFPIVVALLLLIRVESKMEQLGKKIDLLNDTLIQLNAVIAERLRRR
jgi:hypothetical protein